MMSTNEPNYTVAEFQTAHEPKVHPLVRGSFVFLPTVGMRLAPEVLVLELMREVFFEQFADEIAAKSLDPNEKIDDDNRYRIATKEERAVLFALRGRRKNTKRSQVQDFFAPAYPALAQYAWLRRKEARVINGLLFGGAISTYLWHKGHNVKSKTKEQDEIIAEIRKALIGKNTMLEDDPNAKEILSAVLGGQDSTYTFENTHKDTLVDGLRKKLAPNERILKTDEDAMANCITQDLLNICDLEERLPRIQWIQILMTFLRFSLPMWLLSQMRLTDLLHKWLLDAVDEKRIAQMNEIKDSISNRNKSLLHPTLTPTRELFERIESYMKHRIELNILLYSIDAIQRNRLDKTLCLESVGSGKLGIDELLVIASDMALELKATVRFRKVAKELNFSTFLTREGEHFAAWRSPLTDGQGKNIDEFFRVLYRVEEGDDAGGYLLTPEGRGINRGFRVFPGQLLLKTITFLAAASKQSNQEQGGSGMLVLQDVEEHFARYGVDFSVAADARPLLINELRVMGLLKGSPDAGSSVAVACPY